VAYILLNKSMDMNSYTGILAQLSLFGSDSIILGEATAKAKKVNSDQDIRKTWILFGDPTTRLR
jgi:hypothetical protein